MLRMRLGVHTNHGVVTYGSDLLQAYMKMETVELFACLTL